MNTTTQIEDDFVDRWRAAVRGVAEEGARVGSRARAVLDALCREGLCRGAARVECGRCGDTGYLSRYPIRGKFGLAAWLLDKVPPQEIIWCACSIGQRKRRDYEDALLGREARRLQTIFQNAGIPPRFMRLRFDSIPPALQSGKEEALAAAREFAQAGEAQGKKSLCLIGPPGRGKTGILSVAYRKRVEAGVSGLWIELYQFFREIQSGYSSNDNEAGSANRTSVPG